MKDDLELEMNDAWSDDGFFSRLRGRMGSGKAKFFRISLAILLVSIFAGGILYFLTKGGEASPLQSKVTALEQKIAGVEKQLEELQGKIVVSGPDPTLPQRMDALAQKVEVLEKEKRPTVDSRVKPSPPPLKRVVSAEKQYHKVRRGETLVRISKQYGISIGKLRSLNHLSENQSPRPGQKLLVFSRP